MRPSLSEAIQDLAQRGEITHLSLHMSPTTKLWCASFSPASSMGNSYAESKDPVEALLEAFEGIKLRRRPAAKVDKPSDPHEPTPEPAAVPEPDLSDIL